MIDRSHLDALAALVGDRHLLVDPADKARYEIGARYDEGRAAAVVRPATTAEVSAVVAYAVAHGLTLVPQGGNTGLVGAATPDISGTQLVLSLDRLNRQPVVDPTNRTVEVEAGVRLSQLNGLLAEHELFLPIDLGADPMIGGMIATNTGGARYLRYGAMRRQVLGLEVVLPDAEGTVLDLRSGLRKDNSRLDLKQLFIGSCGALGIVTRAVLDVQRRPLQAATALLVPASDDAIPHLLGLVERGCGEYLSALEGMSRNAMARALGHVAQLRNPFARGEIPPYAILVELTRSWPAREGEASLETVLEQVLGELFEQEEPLLADALMGRGEELWALRHSLSEGLRASGHVIGFDLSLRRSDLVAFRREVAGVLGAEFPELAICDFGHIADGGMHFNLVHPGSPDAGEIARVKDRVNDLVVSSYGGSFSGEHALGRANAALYARYTPARVRTLSHALRQVFGTGSVGSVAY